MKQDNRSLKKIFSSTEIQASENLKARIMQKIEFEKTLIQQAKQSKLAKKSPFSTLILLLIPAILIVFNLKKEMQNNLVQSGLFKIIILTSIICSFIFFISVWEDNRRGKHL
jgi:hypothetical protein